MKLNLRFLRFPDTGKNRRIIQSDLEPLRGQLDITAAHATVEPPSERSPAIRAAVHLEVPGPDIVASASDYTFAAAWRKVMKSVQRQVQRRLTRRESRRLTPPIRRNGTPAAGRA